MPKQSGLGDNFYLDEFDLSGDAASVGRVGGGPATTEVTGINKYAPERIGLRIDGAMDFNSWFNDDNVAGAEGAHMALRARPTTDRLGTYCRGTALGAHAASALSKQVSYDPNRGNDGALTFGVNLQPNAYGVEWGQLLTAGKRTDTTATSPVSGVDLGSSPTSYSFGWAAYLHVFAFTGTSVTVTLQDSADGTTFTTLTGGAFTAATGRGAQRLTSASLTATVRRYVRAITTGTFTNAQFAVNFVRYEVARAS